MNAPALKMLICAGFALLLSGSAGAEPRGVKIRTRVAPSDAIAQEMLQKHNEVRVTLKLPPLQWSKSLAVYSQRWADTLRAKDRAAHNPQSPYGENIFITGIGSTPSRVVKEWASEAADYSYRTNDCSTDCGHYTQIIWRDTKKVGCAVARGSNREFWVCSYDPPGNYLNEWPY